MEDILKKASNIATQKHQAQYAEVRAQKLYKTMLTLKEGNVEAAKQGIEQGVAIRVLVNGAWGFASVGSSDINVLADAISAACSMAKTASVKLKNHIKLAQAKVIIDRVQVKPKLAPSDVPIEGKIKTASSINKAILSYDERIKSCTVDYLDLTGTNYFVNSEGSSIQEDKLCVWARITSSAKSQDVLTFSREEIGSTSGYEVFDQPRSNRRKGCETCS